MDTLPVAVFMYVHNKEVSITKAATRLWLMFNGCSTQRETHRQSCLVQSYLASAEIEPIMPASKTSNGLFLEGAFLNIKRQ